MTFDSCCFWSVCKHRKRVRYTVLSKIKPYVTDWISSDFGQGYQIPRGWSVMYSIRDTHETTPAFQSPELFDPDRFGSERDESRSSRFSYVPFGGGVRRCVGKELAQIILKTLAVELIGPCKWTLATKNFPKMQTVPIVHPVNGLHVHFSYDY